MACPPVMTGSLCPLSSNVQECEGSLGTLEKLPTAVVIEILSKLPQPKEASLACRQMNVLAKLAVENQFHDRGMCLYDKGTCPAALSEKWGKKVTEDCLVLLLQFHVDVPALALKDTETALRELYLLLDGRYELLQNPKELKNFLEDRLLENAVLLTKALYQPHVLNDVQKLAVKTFKDGVPAIGNVSDVVSGVRSALSSLSGGVSEQANLPSCSKRMDSVIDYLRACENGRNGAVSGMTVAGRGTVFGSGVPLRTLALLPFELLQIIRRDQAHRHLPQTDQGKICPSLTLDYAQMIPMGISSLDWIEALCIVGFYQRDLSEEIGKMKVKLLCLSMCPNVDHLPLSLTKMPSLECVWISECPKLTPDDPVVKDLTAKGVNIVRLKDGETIWSALAEKTLSETLRNLLAYGQSRASRR